MGSLLWLASYPKSGNTWLRIFLANFFSGDDYPVPINYLGQYGMSLQDTRPGPWKAAIGGIPEDIEQQLVARPYVQAKMAERPGVTFCKTHSACGKHKATGADLINFDVSCGAVYLVRDPRCVAPSWAKHSGTTKGETIRAMNRSGHASQHPKGVYQFFGNWSEHVKSWAGTGALVIRYEDMVREPLETFGKITAYLGRDDPERVEKALQFSSIDRNQNYEQVWGFTERVNGDSFFNGGRLDWRGGITEKQARRLEHKHGEVMQWLGYL